MKRVAVLKLGGELIETKDKLKAMSKAIASASKKSRLVVVHGGGREIDAALAQVGTVVDVMRGESVPAWHFGVITLTSLGYTALCLAALVHLLQKEKIIFGRP